MKSSSVDVVRPVLTLIDDGTTKKVMEAASENANPIEVSSILKPNLKKIRSGNVTFGQRSYSKVEDNSMASAYNEMLLDQVSY